MTSTLQLNLRLVASRRHLKFKHENERHSWSFAIADRMTYLMKQFEDTLMAKSKGKKQARQDWMVDFAAMKLSVADREAFTSWVLEQRKHEVEPMFELVPNGWKTSFSFDAENDCYIASCTQRDEDDVNHNICVVSRSDDPFEALWINYYKIQVMSEGKKLPTERVDDNWG